MRNRNVLVCCAAGLVTLAVIFAILDAGRPGRWASGSPGCGSEGTIEPGLPLASGMRSRGLQGAGGGGHCSTALPPTVWASNSACGRDCRSMETPVRRAYSATIARSGSSSRPSATTLQTFAAIRVPIPGSEETLRRIGKPDRAGWVSTPRSRGRNRNDATDALEERQLTRSTPSGPLHVDAFPIGGAQIGNIASC